MDVNYVLEWGKSNGLLLNAAKTQAIIICASNNPSNDALKYIKPILVEGTPITYR